MATDSHSDPRISRQVLAVIAHAKVNVNLVRTDLSADLASMAKGPPTYDGSIRELQAEIEMWDTLFLSIHDAEEMLYLLVRRSKR